MCVHERVAILSVILIISSAFGHLARNERIPSEIVVCGALGRCPEASHYKERFSDPGYYGQISKEVLKTAMSAIRMRFESVTAGHRIPELQQQQIAFYQQQQQQIAATNWRTEQQQQQLGAKNNSNNKLLFINKSNNNSSNSDSNNSSNNNNVAAGRRIPKLLHIGAKSLTNERTRPFYEELFWRFWPASKNPILSVFVEPNAAVLHELKERLQEYFGADEPTVISAALCPLDSVDQPFYMISPKIYEAFAPENLGMVERWDSWGNLDRNFLVFNIMDVLQNAEESGFSSLAQFEEILPYLVQTSVHCMTPASLLKAAGISPDSLDVLLIDTQEAMWMVASFLSIDGIAPAVIRFHWAWDYRQLADAEFSEKLALLVSVLSARGYKIYQFAEFFVAVAAVPSLVLR